MEIVKTIDRVRKIISRAKSAGKKIGLVPTMGALHEGHFSLIRAAKKQTKFVVVSIFVNPAQFGPGEDLAKYPRPFKKDINACRKLGVDVVFAPTVKQMYPEENITWVNVEKLSEFLCGKSRPGHFRGVATVCSKLFNIVGPDIAFFGQKDAQQAIVIQRMAADLNMPLKIVVCPTVREKDGLAMSSRNAYLKSKERKDAALLYAALQEAEVFIAAGERRSKTLVSQMKKILKISRQIKIDYIKIVDAKTLEDVSRVKGKVLIAVAAKIGKTRLIDNCLVDV
ncbi:MAG: pantoate--beta-alanine ligase [Sedimentisphaerales bacterium]